MQAKLDVPGMSSPEDVRRWNAKRDAMVRGIVRGNLTRKSEAARLQEARDREILRLLRITNPTPQPSPKLYGEFVGSCAKHGWPIVGHRRFMQYLERLEMLGRVVRELQVAGKHGGLRTIVRLNIRRTPSDGGEGQA